MRLWGPSDFVILDLYYFIIVFTQILLHNANICSNWGVPTLMRRFLTFQCPMTTAV